MVNSGSFDSDVDRNEKDGFTQYNNVVESPQSVVSVHAVNGSLCENDFSTQTADSLPVSQAIEPTATKTEYKCNMSEEIRAGDNFEVNCDNENKCVNETCIIATGNATQPYITGEPYVDRYINTGYLRKYKIETKPSICCSVPLDRIPNVLKTCSKIIANRTLNDFSSNKEIVKKYMCLYCDRVFLIPTMKQKHMNRFHFLNFNKRIHLRNQATKCLYCDLNSKEFNMKQLFTHLATKHSEKYFACLQCETRYPSLQLLESHKATAHEVPARLQVEICEDTAVMRDPPSTIKTRIEYKRNTKPTETTPRPNEEVVEKTRRKCQSKYQLSSPATSKTLPDATKLKAKYVKELRSKKLAVISTKVGMKHCLRITRQRSKILENAKNTRKKTPPATTSKNEPISVPAKFIPFQSNSLSLFDISYRVKKITDHSIDNLRISSLTFDDVFDKAFFNRVKCNIQDNLMNFIDGKLFKSIESENRISSFQKTKDVTVEECNSSYGLSNTISSTSEVSTDSQFSEDSESQTEKTTKKKSTPSEDTGNYKYFTRRKYQAVISESKANKDLSKLDIWTQLIMKNRQQKILSDQKTEKEMIEYRKSDEYKIKMQREELNGILDKRGPLEDLKQEAMRTVALEKINSTSSESNFDTYFDVTIILNEILNNLFPKDEHLAVSEKENCHVDINRVIDVEKNPQGEELLSVFNLQRISHTSRVNAIENVLKSDIDKTAITELTGEWARTRIYICASCGIKLPNAKLLVDHKHFYHENVWCQHYEFVGNQGELYRHLSIPGLGKIGAIEDKVENDSWRRSTARVCSKCNKRFYNLGDLHRHMLECGGDLAWMLERKKYKYRPYGSKARKKKRGLLRLLQAVRNRPREKRKKTIKKFKGPRQKPSDADTIQRMLANLPAKRITRKVISLKDGFPRPAINKNIIKAKVKPTSKKETPVIAKKSVVVPNVSINRTRRLLRSNSSILLDNKINLILPKFKRKNNENNKIIKRHSLKNKSSNVEKQCLQNNPVVAACKLTDDQIQILAKPESHAINNEPDTTGNPAESVNENKEPPPLVQNEESPEQPPEATSEHQIENPPAKPPKLAKKKTRKRRQTNKPIENQQKHDAVTKTVLKRKQKVNHISTVTTRKMHLRKNNISRSVTHQRNRRNFVKAKMTEIVQVDGSPHSKSTPKSKISKKDTVLNAEAVVTIPICLPQPSDDVTEPTKNNDEMVTENVDNFVEVQNVETSLESSLNEPLAEDKECKDKLLIKIPPATKKGSKKTRGLNDCIAMLTNKLQDKSLDRGNNVLEAFSLKSFESSINHLLSKNTPNGINSAYILNERVENVTNDLINEVIAIPNGACVVLNGIHKDVSETIQTLVEIEAKEDTAKVDCQITEKEISKDTNELKVNKHKVKHKRKDTRKRQLLTSVSKNVVANDKLQEIQEKAIDVNTIFIGSDFNAVVNDDLKQDNDIASKDSDKFSNSEKENSFNHSIMKTAKPRKIKKKVDKQVLTNVEVAVVTPCRNHVDDIINAVALNETGDSEDELPLSEFVKKHTVEEKPEDVLALEPRDTSHIVNETRDNPSPVNQKEESAAIQAVEKLEDARKPCSKRTKRKEWLNDVVKPDLADATKTTQDLPKTNQEESVEGPSVKSAVDDVETEIKIRISLPINAFDSSITEKCVKKVTDQPEHSTCNSLGMNECESSDVTASNDSTKTEAAAKKKRGRRPKPLTDKVDDEINNAYCEICNKTFRRSENLLKHKRTLTHIAKLSQLEALQRKEQAKAEETEEKCNEVQTLFENIDSVACDEFPESSDVSESLASIVPPQKLVDIINDVLSKPVDSEYVEHRNFSNLILQSDPEVKRCKSLGERKSFDCDKLPIIDTSNTSPIPINANISGSTADVIVEKQISLLENMIEDNRNTFSTTQNAFLPSKIPISDEYSFQSNSSAFSVLSSTKQEDLNGITFTHNTNIIANLIKPNLEDNLMASTQYEQISDDSNSSHLHIEEQKSRKALNRDEELFLECCSLLKSSSDVSDLCRKSVKSTKFLNNFGFKPMDELEWLEQKQLPHKLNVEHNIHTVEIPQTNTSVHDNFYKDLSFPRLENNGDYMEKNENENFFSRPPIFEDISTESDGSSGNSLPNCKSILNSLSEDNSFTIPLNSDDRSSPNVESAQIPFEEDKVNAEEPCDNTDRLNEVDCQDTRNSPQTPPSPLPIIKKHCNAKSIQTNIMDYVVSKKRKHESKKFVTKGALKVFEGLKVSIPKVELDMKEVLSCSPTSKRLEIEAEQDKLEEKKLNGKRELSHRNFVFNKIIKNGKKVGNKLGMKVTKKRYNVETKVNKVHENAKKPHDVYDFEETQDSVDIFIKNSHSLPDYHSFRNKISSKYDFLDDSDEPKQPKEDSKKIIKSNHVTSLPSRKLKMNKCITKKKCMIMGRIFKNALKPKLTDDIKDIPVFDNEKIVEDFVMNCHDMHNKSEKPKLSEEEMNMLFDSLLHDDNSTNTLNKCKEDNVMENDALMLKQKQKVGKCRKRPRGNSPDSSDEEFSIKKTSKKHVGNKKSNVNENVINLEQELKECIGVASRKSQRKCTSGKQNVLVEYWSSDESNLDFETAMALSNIQQIETKEAVDDVKEDINVISQEITVEPEVEPVEQHQVIEERKEVCDKTKVLKAPDSQKKFKSKKAIRSTKEVNEFSLHPQENDSETIASTRQKRNAVDTLYYWSSSSEDEMQDVIEIKSLREDCDEEDRPLQQGWIVGDSPKKLVTMLAQAKGKKLDIEYVKKNRKKRTSV